MHKHYLFTLGALTAAILVCSTRPGAAWVPLPPDQPSPDERHRSVKTSATSARLLLPLFVLDTTDPDGVTTIFEIRNELATPTDVDIHYFTTGSPQAPQRTDSVTLQGKEVRSINVRLVENLETDGGGMARGFVIVEALEEGAVIQGNYFRVTSNENFASGFRLVNIDPASPHNDLCQLFTLRFLNGGGFDSGTRYIVWLESELAPDPSNPVLFVQAFDQAGREVLFKEFFADEVAFEVTAEQFLSPFFEAFGAIELQFMDTVGHVSAIMDADGRYSVGLEAACTDL